jgi:diguanylate cyclase (GGDEF)-like protein/PAS domain S-box-containing protein
LKTQQSDEILLFTQFAMDNAPTEIYWLGSDARIRYVNKQVCKTLGYTKEELLQLVITDLDPFFPIEKWDKHWQALKTDITQVFEARHRPKNGELMPVQVTTNYVKFGCLEYIVAYCTDITERKNAENMLSAANANLMSVLKAIPDLLFEFDLQGVHCNMFAREPDRLLATQDAIIGHSVSEILPPQEAQTVLSAIREAAISGTSKGHLLLLPMPYGMRWFELSTSLKLTDRENDPHFIVLARDVTERKQAENEARNNIEQIKIRDHVLSQISQGVLISDPQRKLTYANKGIEKLTGYKASELIGNSCAILQGKETDQGTIQTMRTALNEEREFKGEILNYRKDGTEFWNDLTITPIFDDDRKLIHFIGVQHDITRHKLNEERIRKLALYDSLTQLPNRRLLNDRLGQTLAASKRSGRYGAVMFIDLDNFKPLNDQHGHEVGDLLLIEAANRLKKSVREIDTAARFGGDEFVVVLSDLSSDEAASIDQARQRAEVLLAELSSPYVLMISNPGLAAVCVEHQCTASIGIVLFINQVYMQDDIIKWADAAMYRAKAEGKNSIRFYAEKI